MFNPKTRAFVLAGCLSCSLFGSKPSQDPSHFSPNIRDVEKEETCAVNFEARFFKKKKLDSPSNSEQKVAINTYEMTFETKDYLPQNWEEKHRILLSYRNRNFNWKHNPNFSSQAFDYVGIIYKGLLLDKGRWDLRASLKAEVDPQNFDFAHNSQSQLTLQSRYALNPSLNFYAGVGGFLGVSNRGFYPIAGLDWEHKGWHLDAFYPTYFRLMYKVNKQWRVAAISQYIFDGNRLAEKANIARGVVETKQQINELKVSYLYNKNVHGSLAIGYTGRNDVTVRDAQAHEVDTYRIKTAPFFTAGIEAQF